MRIMRDLERGEATIKLGFGEHFSVPLPGSEEWAKIGCVTVHHEGINLSGHFVGSLPLRHNEAHRFDFTPETIPYMPEEVATAVNGLYTAFQTDYQTK